MPEEAALERLGEEEENGVLDRDLGLCNSGIHDSGGGGRLDEKCQILLDFCNNHSGNFTENLRRELDILNAERGESLSIFLISKNPK